jgi:hypothetical protein
MSLVFCSARGNRGGTYAATAAAPVVTSGAVPAIGNSYAVTCDGTNDYVDLGTGPNSAFNDNSGDFTISIWFNYAANVSYDGLIANGYPVQIYLQANKIKTYLSSTASASYFISGAATDTTFSTDTWYHLGIIRSGTSFDYYVNGTLDEEYTASGTTYISAYSLKVGTWNGSVYMFDGMVDEFALWDTALTADNMKEIYDNDGARSPGAGDLSSLSPFGWWRMGDNDSGTGTTVTDQGSDSNDGTLTNGAAFLEDTPPS